MDTYQIEVKVERAMDRLDARFMGGGMTQKEYDAAIKQLDQWAQSQYDAPDYVPSYKS